MAKNKRGISDVIATVLMIMVTIVAIAVIAEFVVPFVNNSLQKSTECNSYNDYYTFDTSFGYNCKDVVSASNLYAVSVKSSFDSSLAGEVKGMKIVFNDRGGTSKTVEVINGSTGSGEIWALGSSRTSDLKTPRPGGITTYVYQASADDDFVSAEVYPILKSNRICSDVKESINLGQCSGRVN